MIIAKNDEAKRSKIWMVVTIVSSVLIIVIAVYLLTKMFTANPLEGKWEAEDDNYSVTISKSSTMTVHIPELLDNKDVSVKMDYVLDKDEKTVTVKINDEEIKKIAEKSDGLLTEETLRNALSSITTTFDYSVDKNRLTLTEREYGEQTVFVKK